MEMAESSEYVSPSKAAALIGKVSPGRVKAWAIRGRIRSRKLPSGQWQVCVQDVMQIRNSAWKGSEQ